MQLESIRRAAQVVICAVWLSGGAAAFQAAQSFAAESPSEVDWEGRVLGALARVGEPGSRAARETARGLAGFGEVALPALLSGLAQRRVTSAEGASLSLDEGRLAILRDAVEQLGRSALVSAAEAALAEHAEYPMPERLPPYLEGIALCGRSADIGVALDLARASETDELAGLAAQRGLERAVRAVAARDASALRELRRWLERASPTMDLALVRGTAACGRPEALRALMDVFGEDEDLTLTLLGEMPRAAHGLARPLDDSLLRKVRDVLADAAAPPARVRAALRAAAALGD
ncbi:MAG TPA: hypothetical protein VMT18_14990, partial [Planctomycetota bacterium]|nr:hypothetical protein [Planctomycetota bacterium]